MGQVYLAQDLTLGRRVALKLIKRSVMQGDGVERFLEEARATASFNHPHIVTIHAVGEHDGRPYLALEYIDGESLRARLKAGPAAGARGAALRPLDGRGDRRGAPARPRPRRPQARERRHPARRTRPRRRLRPRQARRRPAPRPPPARRRTWRPSAGAARRRPARSTLGARHDAPRAVAGRRPLSDAALLRLPYSKDPPELGELPSAPWAPLVSRRRARRARRGQARNRPVEISAAASAQSPPAWATAASQLAAAGSSSASSVSVPGVTNRTIARSTRRFSIRAPCVPRRGFRSARRSRPGGRRGSAAPNRSRPNGRARRTSGLARRPTRRLVSAMRDSPTRPWRRRRTIRRNRPYGKTARRRRPHP